jgi:outer membrane protein TolC
MRARNEALMAAQDDVDQRMSERKAARGLRYPKAEIEMRHVFLDDPIQVGVDPIPLSLTVQDDQFDQGQMSVSWPLYTGGRIDAVNRATEARVDEARAQGRTTEEQLVTELAQRYFGLCLALRNRAVQTVKVEAMEQHAYRSRRLMEEGIIARVEHLNAQVALANAQQELQAAERDVAIVQEGLSNILAGSGPVEPATPLFILRALEPREAFQGYVDAGHPVMAMLDAKQNLAQQGVRAEEGADRPTVYLFGRHELFPSDLTMLDPQWAMGIGLQYTLFDGFQGKHKTAAARAQARKVTHLRQKIQRDLKSLVLKRYEELEKAREQYDTFGATLDLTAENLRVRTRAFEEGVSTSLEVVDATLSHARAQLGRVKAAYDFDLAFFQLLEASGRTGYSPEYLAKAVPVADIEASTGVPDAPLLESMTEPTGEPARK